MNQSIDEWFAFVSGQGRSGEVFSSLSSELPSLCSLILDRSCRFQCKHCIFQSEGRTESLPEVNVVLNVLHQLHDPKVVHEGRQLTSKQLPLLKALSSAGYSVGIIESGTYVSLVENILHSELCFDWMDISIDGLKPTHNIQRASTDSWDIAVRGLRQARQVVRPGGKVTSLFTITSLNYDRVEETRYWLQDQAIDEWHLTTMSLRPGIETLQASKKQLEIAVSQMLKVGNSQQPLFLKVYNLDDLQALISIFGKEVFSKSSQKAEVTQNAIVLDVGFPLLFYPQSLAPGETLVVDVDGWWRLPYCIKYTLEELRRGIDTLGRDISIYNVLKLTKETNVKGVYEKAVRRWQEFLGLVQLEKEREVLQELF